MPNLSPQEVAAKWKQRTSAASPDYVKGVRGVTENPAAAAAAKSDKWLMSIQEAAANDRFRKGLQRVTLQDWQKAAAEKGGQRIAAGVQGAETRVSTFLQGFLPAQAAITNQTKAMPSNTLQDRIARMVHQATAAADLKGRF